MYEATKTRKRIIGFAVSYRPLSLLASPLEDCHFNYIENCKDTGKSEFRGYMGELKMVWKFFMLPFPASTEMFVFTKVPGMCSIIDTSDVLVPSHTSSKAWFTVSSH